MNSALSAEGRKPCDKCSEECLSVIQSVEVGHTFQLGTDFTQPFRVVSDSKNCLVMNCFGLGVGWFFSYLTNNFLFTSDICP